MMFIQGDLGFYINKKGGLRILSKHGKCECRSIPLFPTCKPKSSGLMALWVLESKA